MKITIYIFLTLIIVFFTSKYFLKNKTNTKINIYQQTEKSEITKLVKKHLSIDIPKDLEDLWNGKEFYNKNRKFYYYNYRDLNFLSTQEVHEFTKQRDVQGSMDEINNISLENPKKKQYYTDFFQDPVMLSKFTIKKIKGFEKINKCLVFASSVYNEHFIQMFYAFDKKNKNLGIWITKGEKSKYPSKIGNNLNEIFKNIEELKDVGFESNRNFITYFYKTCEGEHPKTPFGIYPNSIKKIINKNISNILWLNDAYIEKLDENKKNEIEKFFSKQGLNVNLLDNNYKFLLDKINSICANNFNPNSKFNFMKISLENYCEGGYGIPLQNGIVFVDKNQARFLDKLFALNFGNYNDKKKYKFLEYEK